MEEIHNNKSNIDPSIINVLEEIKNNATVIFFKYLICIVAPNETCYNVEQDFNKVIEKAKITANNLLSMGKESEASRILSIIEVLEGIRNIPHTIQSEGTKELENISQHIQEVRNNN
ncbi:MAG: hypothetical protein QXE70_04330 [Ignisphaera sp.]